MPPVAPAVDEHATMPPGAEDRAQLDDARTMAPPRFRHLRNAVGDPSPVSFSEEEVPTNKVPRLLGRVETRQRTVPVARVAEEHTGGNAHTDHAVARSKKSTQLGLAPVFEALPEDALEEQMTVPVPRKPTPPPPPPPLSQTPPQARLFHEEEGEYELAGVLEGSTVLAPGPHSGGTAAWLQALLLLTLIAGVGVAGWLLWSRSGSVGPTPIEASRELGEGPSKGPITGTVNGFEEPEKSETKSESASDTKSETETESEPASDTASETETESELASDTASETETESAKAEPAPKAPFIPTQNLPRDPAKASDVLVHRALRLVRRDELGRAQATLDRAWELDPRNPQAMAGYAALYLARKDGERAEKWAKRAVKKRSRRAQYHILYGDALELQGDLAGARKAWRKALSLEPNNRAAKNRLAESSASGAN